MAEMFKVRVYHDGEVRTVSDFEKGDTLQLTDDYGKFMTLEFVDDEITIRFANSTLVGRATRWVRGVLAGQ